MLSSLSCSLRRRLPASLPTAAQNVLLVFVVSAVVLHVGVVDTCLRRSHLEAVDLVNVRGARRCQGADDAPRGPR
eukprot:13116926-Heterocapsa_arctica.AAC.1